LICGWLVKNGFLELVEVFMKRCRTVQYTLMILMCLVSTTTLYAADNEIGTWNLNPSKSTYSPGPPPKSQIIKIEAVEGGLKEVVDRVTAQGKAIHFEWTAKFDGKNYPVDGDPDQDSVSLRRIDDYTIEVISKKGGKITTRNRIVVARDGKSRTAKETGINVRGQRVNNTIVFDRETNKATGPIIIAQQGSFFVAGRKLHGQGVFNSANGIQNAGQTFWVDQMYVQYQIPTNPRAYPIVLVHGNGGTGRVWESTPDEREGYQTILLRFGYPVYIVDFPRRGRAGQPTFNGTFGELNSMQVVPNLTQRFGVEFGWVAWRLGPSYPDTFEKQQFPMDSASIDQFFKGLVPTVADDPSVITDALVALLDKIGPAILVTHSQSGLFGWRTAMSRPNLVKGIISYEPGLVFPLGAVPPPIPLLQGTMAAGSPVPAAEFAKLAGVPIQIVFGDNIPSTPVADPLVDRRRALMAASRLFAEALASRGGDISILHLPEVGLRGNSHFMFSDLNNLDVADQLSLFLKKKALDIRK
jgi:pimeloyl-ACP methyl ester carboxylesterase